MRLYAELVYRWCRNAGLQSDDAADVSQDVFRIVSQKIDSFEPGRKASGNFRAWLWGIARIQILDYHRKRHRQPIGSGGSDANQLLTQLEDYAEQPATVDNLDPRQILLNSALEILQPKFDPTTWQSFWRMSIEGHSAKEIGNDLNLTSSAVRQAKYRVICKLREILGDDYPDQD